MAQVEPKSDREERDEIRNTRIEIGAAVQLLATGELKAVLPLDREKELDAANPVPPNLDVGPHLGNGHVFRSEVRHVVEPHVHGAHHRARWKSLAAA